MTGILDTGLRRSQLNQTPEKGNVIMMSKEFSNVQNQMFQVTSSSSSPGKGDSPTSISKMRTPRPHQSTARVYEVSVSTFKGKTSLRMVNGLRLSPLEPGILVCHRRCQFCLHNPSPPYTTQSLRSWRSLLCPTTSCPAWGPCNGRVSWSSKVKLGHAEHEGFGAWSVFRLDRFRTCWI